MTNQSLCYLPIKRFVKYFKMSKKAQQVKEVPKPKEAQEEIDPFLKTLQKKVRNINKKLTQIQELEGKDNLKPEQIQKVNRKQSLYEERAKIQEFATLFRESYNENFAVYRNNQLKELEVLARALVIFQSGIKIPEQDKLSSLWKAVQNSGKEGNSLNESIAALATIFKDFANDRNLQKKLTTHVEAYGQTKVEVSKKLEQKPHVFVEKSEAKTQGKHEVKTEPIRQAVIPQIETTSSEPKVEHKAIVQEKATTIPQEVVEKQPNQKARQKEDKSSKGPREKKHFKPKYVEKKPEEPKYEGQKPNQDEESSEEQPDPRNFHLDQVQKLEEEGFIVVGKSKPKPKPKDTRELKNFHDQQHGKKFHAHHVSTNF